MTKLARPFLPHLTIRESTLPSAVEWTPKPIAWALIHIRAGTGYWMSSRANQSLETGAILLLSHQPQESIRATRLGALSLDWISIEPERLASILTLSEQRFLEAAGLREESSVQIFPPLSPLASSVNQWWATGQKQGSLFRLRLLQLFLGAFGTELG